LFGLAAGVLAPYAFQVERDVFLRERRGGVLDLDLGESEPRARRADLRARAAPASLPTIA
jgi:hypothetical protein